MPAAWTVDRVLERVALGYVYLGDDVRRDGELLGTVRSYTGQCAACGQRVDARTVAHGFPLCRGAVLPRVSTVVTVWRNGVAPILPNAWRKATAAERRAILTLPALDLQSLPFPR